MVGIFLAAAAIYLSPLEKAVHMVESSGSTASGIVGDNGDAIGPMQIHRGCWTDAVEYNDSIGGEYSDCDGLEYSLKIFRAYLARYAKPKRIGSMPYDEAAARIWNGGPNGHKKKATLKYWKKVSKHL